MTQSVDFSALIEPVARELLGEPNDELSKGYDLRFGANGSLAVDLEAGQWYSHEDETGGGVLDLLAHHLNLPSRAEQLRWLEEHGFKERSNSPAKPRQQARQVATYDYTDENGELLFQAVRMEPKSFRQRRPDGNGWKWSVKGIRQVPYRLPELLANPDALVFVVEGEKDADRLADLGLLATCNAAGAGKWTNAHSEPLANRRVIVLPDNDAAGRDHAEKVRASLEAVGAQVRTVALPGLPEKGDVSDWLDNGGNRDSLLTLLKSHDHDITPQADETALTDSLSDILIDGEVSEDALALMFEREHESDMRYCHTTGAWFCWDGTRWKRDQRQLAFNYARVICRQYGGGAVKFSKAAVASAVERFASAAPALAADSSVWDNSPWLIGTPGGVIDLQTGKLREARHDDYITRTTSIAPENGEPTRWLAFLRDTTRNDEGLIRFLQQVAGYCLTGSTREHALFFIYGAGGNGKSVFLNTLTGIIGEYSATAAMDAFTASKHDKHPTDLAMLQGARLVTASETEDGRAWAEAKIKQMTGGDPITARFMRRDFFTYQPEFKLVIVGNHKPELRNVDDATRRRFNIIPFIHKPTEPDPNLEQALRDEWPRILSWAIAGALDWQQNGLVRPAVVADATNEYFEEQDLFGQWLEDRCEFAPGYRETSTSLFGSWRAYAQANADDEGTAKSFGAALKKRGFETYRRNNERGFKGLRIRQFSPQMHGDDDMPW